MDIGTKVTLSNGVEMPRRSVNQERWHICHHPEERFGTFRLDGGREARSSVFQALEAGYCLIDTASMYCMETLDSFNEDLHIGWDPRGAP